MFVGSADFKREETFRSRVFIDRRAPNASRSLPNVGATRSRGSVAGAYSAVSTRDRVKSLLRWCPPMAFRYQSFPSADAWRNSMRCVSGSPDAKNKTTRHRPTSEAAIHRWRRMTPPRGNSIARWYRFGSRRPGLSEHAIVWDLSDDSSDLGRAVRQENRKESGTGGLTVSVSARIARGARPYSPDQEASRPSSYA